MERLTKAEFAKRRAIRGVIEDVFDERLRQNEKWGEQNHPDMGREFPATARLAAAIAADHWKRENDTRVKAGTLGWDGILLEEVYEAIEATGNPVKLREELVQVAAVAAAWVEAIDRRQAKEAA